MSKFVSEPDEIRPVEDGPPITTAGSLLNALRVSRADTQQQRRAVAEWLRENEPSELLLSTLRARGLVD